MEYKKVSDISYYGVKLGKNTDIIWGFDQH